MWIVLLIATGEHPWKLVIGTDGQPSTSKFQMLVWTAAVVFGFLAILEFRYSLGYHGEMPGMPTNLLIAMGISIATAVSAKSIAVNSQAKSDQQAADAAAAAVAPPAAPVVVAAGEGAAVVAVPAAAPPVVVTVQNVATSKSGIFSDDSGMPDLGKVQLVLWTVIAVGVFLYSVIVLIQNPGCPTGSPAGANCGPDMGLPDIGQTLMILMGLGNGAYIGKKIAAG
jgi:hypothetical protein